MASRRVLSQAIYSALLAAVLTAVATHAVNADRSGVPGVAGSHRLVHASRSFTGFLDGGDDAMHGIGVTAGLRN